jgi:deoxyribonuclease-4
MRLGAHVSAAGGLDKAIDRGVDIGCEAIQIFASPPQGWAFKSVPQDQISLFRLKAGEADIWPVFFHAIYLINLGTSKQENLDKGMDSLIKYMELASELKAAGVIFHPGSHGGAGYEAIFEQVVTSIHHVLNESSEGPWLTLENTAGMGQHIGASFKELGAIIEAVDSPRVKVCLDTQHCFAAGYDVSTKQGVEDTMAEFDRHVGLERLVAVHANDSKRPLGAGVDRHENIGQGSIGLAGFEEIMSHPAFKDIPFYLEVPGVEKLGPDKVNLDILKDIRSRVTLGF